MLKDWGSRSARWAGIRSELIEVRGTRVNALRAGDDRGGVPQLLVHGLGGAATNWLEVMSGLAAHGPVLAIDLPGFGRTEPPRPGASRVGANARFLHALLDEVGFERAVVHGNSMGGMLTTLLAAREPERVAGIVLVSPALPTPRRELTKLSSKTFTRFAPFFVPGAGAAVMRRAWQTMTPEQLWQDTVDFVHGDPTRISQEIAAVGIENLAYGREVTWRLPGFVSAAESLVAALISGRALRDAIDVIPAPALVVWGDRDQLVGRPVIDELARRREDWRIEILAGVGHVAQIEVPDRYLELVADWAGSRVA